MFNREFKTGRIFEAPLNLVEIQRGIDEDRLRALARGTLRAMNPETGLTERAITYYCVSENPPRFYTQSEAQDKTGIYPQLGLSDSGA